MHLRSHGQRCMCGAFRVVSSIASTASETARPHQPALSACQRRNRLASELRLPAPLIARRHASSLARAALHAWRSRGARAAAAAAVAAVAAAAAAAAAALRLLRRLLLLLLRCGGGCCCCCCYCCCGSGGGGGGGDGCCCCCGCVAAAGAAAGCADCVVACATCRARQKDK